MSFSLIQHLDFIDFTRDCKDANINLFNEEQHGFVSVYVQDNEPVIFLKEITSFSDEALKQIADVQHICWNYQKVIFLYVYTKTEIRIYNCSERPSWYKKNDFDDEINKKLNDLEIFACKIDDQSKLKTLNSIFSRLAIDTGFIWSAEEGHEVRKKINQQNRVDKYLIQCLINLSVALKKEGLEDEELIHKLVMRSLFLLYLEDRKATNAEFYEEFDINATSYFDILNHPNYTYELYKKLATDFNGSLFTVEENEKQKVNYKHLDLIKKCFINGNVNNEQIDLFHNWRLFDFSIIRIELLSEIYENFLSKLTKKETGTFYTPPSLVELILNEKLPFDSKEYNVKILDPSCGSGIFLVQSFKRLVKRYENKQQKKLTDFKTLVSILKENIFGIEIDDKSIKVAAFSLYLALLDKLDPKTDWWNGSIQFPYLINNPDDNTLKEQGNNLYKRDTISDLSNIEKLKNFQLVIGNPPFGTKKLLKSIINYCNNEKFAKEMVLPFLHKATLFAPNGEIALIFNTKVLTNTGGTYQNFRKWLFNETYVEKIYNFSILRKAKKNFGGQLFGSAVEPISIIFFSNKNIKKIDKINDALEYFSPKTYIKNNVLEGIIIDDTDIVYLPRLECKKPNSKIWKIAMWGSYFDFNILNKYSRNTLKDYFTKEGCVKGTGLHVPPSNHNRTEQIVIPNKIIDTNKISRYYLTKNSLSDNSKEYLRIDENLHKAPLVIIKKGITKGKVFASYVDFDAFFLNRVYGIKCDNINDMKILLSFINSTFSKYFQFNYSSAWGLKYDDILDNELYAMPNIFELMNENIRQKLLININLIIEIKKENFNQDTSHLEKEIDQIIYNDILKLTSDEQQIIQDTLDYGLDLFEKQEKSNAVKHVVDIDQYTTRISKELNDWLEEAELKVSTILYHINKNCPLYMIKLSFGNEVKPTVISNEDIYEQLKKLDNKLISENTKGLYFRKKLNYYDNNDVFIIKPNQRRFWSQTAAMEDSKTILADILKMK